MNGQRANDWIHFLKSVKYLILTTDIYNRNITIVKMLSAWDLQLKGMVLL